MACCGASPGAAGQLASLKGHPVGRLPVAKGRPEPAALADQREEAEVHRKALLQPQGVRGHVSTMGQGESRGKPLMAQAGNLCGSSGRREARIGLPW